MTTPTERSRAFLFGLELLQDLLDPRKTPRVPSEVRERARRVLRHYPYVSDLARAVEPLFTSDAARPAARLDARPSDEQFAPRLRPVLFDVDELDRYVDAMHERMRSNWNQGLPDVQSPDGARSERNEVPD